MWRPERLVQGPRVASAADVSGLNRVFSDAFTDRYRRDGLSGVRVPPLNPEIWHYAIRDAGDGAMVWYDEEGEVVAFNIAHSSGHEGWMGPLAVRTDRQGMGLGRTVVEAAVEWLRERDVRVLGLETMPRTVDNIGFYSRLGFVPGHLTVTMTGDAPRRGVAGAFLQFSRLAAGARAQLIARCRERLHEAAPGYDYTREIELTDELGIGDAVVLERGGAITAFALWHSAALADVRPADELRVLKLFADGEETFARLLVVIEACATKRRIRRVAIRCQTAFAAAYHLLIRRGYRVRWTDLRMTLEGYPEVVPAGPEIVFSNWEI